MSVDQIMSQLESLGSAKTVKIFRDHGATGDMFGVKIADLKNILKGIKGDQELAMQLWDTGNADAMYLAALAADGSLMTRRQLDRWAKSAWWHMLSEYSVPFVASENAAAFKIAQKWINSKQEHIATSGWCTYAAAVSVRPDEDLDLDEIQQLLKRVESEICKTTDRIRYCMNGFVIAVGAYVKPLLKDAKATAKRVGRVEVDMGKTACKVPLASDAIAKVEFRGRAGRKRKTAKC